MEHHNAWVVGYNGTTVTACVQGVFCTAISWLLIALRVAERPKLTVHATYAYLLPMLITCTVVAPAFRLGYDHDAAIDEDSNIRSHLELPASLHAALDVLAPLALLLMGLRLGTERWSRPVMYSLLTVSAGRMFFVLTGAPHAMPMQSVGCLPAKFIMIQRACCADTHSFLVGSFGSMPLSHCLFSLCPQAFHAR
jgi:hypothetical protein